MRFGDIQIHPDANGYWLATSSGIIRIFVEGPEWLPQAVRMWESQGAAFSEEGLQWIERQQVQSQIEDRRQPR